MAPDALGDLEVWLVTGSHSIRRATRDANSADTCIGVIAWRLGTGLGDRFADVD
jgi:hypothetical protein